MTKTLSLGDWKKKYWDIFQLTNLKNRIEVLGGDKAYSHYYSALDSIQDMNGALYEFAGIQRKPTQLECLGFMQALTTLQDAVQELSNILNSRWKISDVPNLSNIRDVRNRVVGHPVKADHRNPSSTAFFTYGNIYEDGFTAVVQFEGNWENYHVDFVKAAELNDKSLALQMKLMFPKIESLATKL